MVIYLRKNNCTRGFCWIEAFATHVTPLRHQHAVIFPTYQTCDPSRSPISPIIQFLQLQQHAQVRSFEENAAAFLLKSIGTQRIDIKSFNFILRCSIARPHKANNS